MKCKVYKIISIVCSLILFFNLQVYSFASTTSGSEHYNWSTAEKFTYFLLNWGNILGDGYSMIIGADDADDVYTDFFDLVSQEYLEENQTFDEWCLSNTSWYYDNSGIQNENTVTGFSMTPTMADALQLTVNNYVSSNPLTYYETYIKSYNFLSPNQFTNYAQYAQTKDFIKNSNGICLLNYSMSYGQLADVYICVIPRTVDFNLIGNVTNGVFNNVNAYIGWTQTGQPFKVDNRCYVKIIHGNGTITDLQGYEPSFGSLSNNETIATLGNGTVFTSNSRNEYVFVFKTLNALKNFNSGTPQPYYLGSDFGTHKSNYSISDFPNSNNSYYNQVINNIQGGWNAQQVLDLVDKIIDNGGSSNGGSSDSENNQSKWWERIGNAIGNLIDGLVDVLTKVIEKLSDALLSIIHLLTGYTDDSGVYHAGLFDKLTDLVDSGFSSFISSMFSWLPEEIVTLLTATLVFGIFFGIFKMLRR